MIRRKKRETCLSDLLEGIVICPQCSRAVPIAGKQPLTLCVCDFCSKGHVFIPWKLAGFWLYRPLGGGAMGAVYKAFVEQAPEKRAAVKILPRGREDDCILIANLENEIRIIRDLGIHPCIVSIIDAGYHDGEYFLATEFIEGERLDQRISRMGRIPELEVLSLALRLVQGLTHIWNRGYLFRDMKPENVIMHEAGAFLFDYGICQRIEDAYEDQGDVVSGSPLYLPPERMGGDVEKAYSEIYSLGMVLYHCIKGRPFYDGKDAYFLARQHTNPLRLSNLMDDKMEGINPEIAAVLKKMVAREPENRYQNFSDVEQAFTGILLNYLKEVS